MCADGGPTTTTTTTIYRREIRPVARVVSISRRILSVGPARILLSDGHGEHRRMSFIRDHRAETRRVVRAVVAVGGASRVRATDFRRRTT